MSSSASFGALSSIASVGAWSRSASFGALSSSASVGAWSSIASVGALSSSASFGTLSSVTVSVCWSVTVAIFLGRVILKDDGVVSLLDRVFYDFDDIHKILVVKMLQVHRLSVKFHYLLTSRYHGDAARISVLCNLRLPQRVQVGPVFVLLLLVLGDQFNQLFDGQHILGIREAQ